MTSEQDEQNIKEHNRSHRKLKTIPADRRQRATLEIILKTMNKKPEEYIEMLKYMKMWKLIGRMYVYIYIYNHRTT